MTPQQIYSWHVPLALALLILVALMGAVETIRRRR
jgi:hypothetical protein